MRYRAVIFDMDGLLIDSERLVMQAWKAIAEKHGYTDLLVPYMDCIGTNKKYSELVMKRYYGEDFPFKALDAEKTQYYVEHFGRNTPLKKGAKELVSYLKEAGWKVALASSTREEICRRTLEHHGLLSYMDAICCGDQVQNSKPAPDIYLLAAQKLGVEPAVCIGIEDSFNGIRAIHAAGMLPIMVPDLKEPDAEIRGLAQIVRKDLTEVESWFREMDHGRN